MMRNETQYRVAIVGFGTVGRAVAKILCTRPYPELKLTRICNRNVARKKVDWVPADVTWTERFEDLLTDDVDIVVELIGGLTPAQEMVRRALKAGKSVVTANKQLVASAGTELAALADEHGREIRFEAAVAGGIPVVGGLENGLAGDRLVRIEAILNGTCNYILTRMESAGMQFDVALGEAQKLGFAEADPTDDIDGLDARAKLAILSAVALQRPVRVADIPCRTISTITPVDFVYARRLNCAIRQVSWAEIVMDQHASIRAAVQPALVPNESVLARTVGSQNVVVVEGVSSGETAFVGHGAGGDPTAVAVVSDLLAIARHRDRPPARSGVPAGRWHNVIQEHFAPRYIRFVVADRPGIIAAVAATLSRHDINIDSVLQEPGWEKSSLPFVVTVEACSTSIFETALHEIHLMDFNVTAPLGLSILKHERA